jgi:GR25 family glycosyltransferase involved in LPS biosynthesis/lysophospholipase L1-like esterase
MDRRTSALEMTPGDQPLPASAEPAEDPNSAAAIERALSTETDPQAIARDRFRLAQAYHHAGQREQAIDSYLKRADLGFSADEVFISLCYAAKLRQDLGQPEDQVIAAYLKAADFAPTRAEPLYAVANYCRFRGRNEEGYQHAKRASAIPKPEHGLWVEPWPYDVGVLDELTVNGYWAGHYRESMDAGLKLLVEADLSPGQRAHVAENVRLSADKLDALAGAAANKRYIRLKEFPPSGEFSNTPAPNYVAAQDSSFRAETYKLSTDANGFIRSHVQVPETAGKIIVLGDSVVESMFLHPQERFCSRLQDLLRDGAGLDVEVLNAGYSGATALHSLNVFLNKIVPLRPAAVVFMSGIVDVDAATMTRSFWNKDAWLEPIVTAGEGNKAREKDFLGFAAFEDRERLLTLLAQAADSFGVQLYFATVAHRQVFEGEYVAKAFRGREDFDRQVSLRREMNEVTRRCAAATGRPLFDVERDLAAETGIFSDMFHLNDAGGEAVAKALVNGGIAKAIATNSESIPSPKSKAVAVSSAQLIRQVSQQELSAVLEINLINLDRSTERLARFQERNSHLKTVRRFPAVDGNLIDIEALIRNGDITKDLRYKRGTLGCAFSHIELWRQSVRDNRILTIFEDDVVTSVNFEAEVHGVLSATPEDWDVIQWGYIYHPSFIWLDFEFAKANLRFYDFAVDLSKQPTFRNTVPPQPFRLTHSFGLQAYSITPRGAKGLLEKCIPLADQNVIFPGTGIVSENLGIDTPMNDAYPLMKSYLCLPPLVISDVTMISDRVSTD